MSTQNPSTKRKRPDGEANPTKQTKQVLVGGAGPDRGHIFLVERDIRLRGQDDDEEGLRRAALDLAQGGFAQERDDGATIFGNKTGQAEYDSRKHLDMQFARLERKLDQQGAQIRDLCTKNDRVADLATVVARAIRRRFLLTFVRKSTRSVTKRQYNLIESGHAAAHHGDVRSDVALLTCFPCEDGERVAFEQMYGVSVERAEQLLQYPHLVNGLNRVASYAACTEECKPRRQFLLDVGRNADDLEQRTQRGEKTSCAQVESLPIPQPKLGAP